MPDPFEGFEQYKDKWTNGQPFTTDPFEGFKEYKDEFTLGGVIENTKLACTLLSSGEIILNPEQVKENISRAKLIAKALQQMHGRHLDLNKPE